MANKYNGMKRAGDWVGKQVKLAKQISNGAGVYPKGTTATVENLNTRGLLLLGTGCAHCGVKMYITRVGYFDIELVDETGDSQP